MSETELTALQKAQQELLNCGVSGNPADNANSAQINGLLMSVRLNALIALVGAGDPEFQKLYDAECLSQVLKLTAQIKELAARPKIALAS